MLGERGGPVDLVVLVDLEIPSLTDEEENGIRRRELAVCRPPRYDSAESAMGESDAPLIRPR